MMYLSSITAVALLGAAANAARPGALSSPLDGRSLMERQECLNGPTWSPCANYYGWCCPNGYYCYDVASGDVCCCPEGETCNQQYCENIILPSVPVVSTPAVSTPAPVSTPVVTPAPSSNVIIYETYYWTISWSYTWYYYIDTYITWSWYIDYTTISYSATASAAAESWFESYSATAILPTSPAATSLASLYTPSATGAPYPTGGATTATGTGGYVPPTLSASGVPTFTGASNPVGPSSGLLMAALAAVGVVPGVLMVLL